MIICHKHKAQNNAAFFWSVIHKAIVVNIWHGRISAEIDKSYPHCGLPSCGVSGAHILQLPFGSTSVPYATNIIWQLFTKRGNLGPQNLFLSMMQCLFDELLSKRLKPFARIWFFLKSILLWII